MVAPSADPGPSKLIDPYPTSSQPLFQLLSNLNYNNHVENHHSQYPTQKQYTHFFLFPFSLLFFPFVSVFCVRGEVLAMPHSITFLLRGVKNVI